jgi:hypothetical protein
VLVLAPLMDSLPGRSDKSRVQLTYSSGSLKVAPRIKRSPRRLTMRISLAIAFLMALASLAGLAQQPAGRGGAAQRGGARVATTDPKAVIAEMQNSLGMLRGLQEQDSVNRIEYWGTGGSASMQGRSYPLEKFRVSINYSVPGMRVDLARSGAREIRVVADKYAWNEDAPGGKAMPMPAALNERLLDLWMTPIGFAKAAAASDKTRVAMEGTSLTVTTEAAGATAKAVLNALYEPERIEARLGSTLVEYSYTEYGDWNDDAKADVFLPKHVVQKRDGVVILDLMVEHTNTYNPYVIMPVPANVSSAAGPRH